MRRGIVVALLLCILAPGMAPAQTFSKRKMEDVVRQILEQRAGVRGASIECPVATPIGVGNRAVCSATARDGAAFSVALIQTDETGGVTFTLTDIQAVEALEPAAQTFFDAWKAGDAEGIYDRGHESLHEAVRRVAFAQLLRCTVADFGGLESMGEVQGAVIHRGDGSAQLLAQMRFGAGPGKVKLDYRNAGDDWLLTGVSFPVLEIEPASVESDALIRAAARIFERADADDWKGVFDSMSYELRGEATDAQIREALDDPWELGRVERVELTGLGRNVNGLPIVFARLVRETGEQRTWLVYRSCGDDWKVRVMQLLDPATDMPVAAMSDIQTDIVKSAHDQGLDLELECPGIEIANMPGITYTCTASHDSGLSAPLEIRVGEDGDFSWELLADDDWDRLLE